MLEFWQELFSGGSPRGNTKRPVVVFRKKIHAARLANQVEEPEAGRTIQTQMNNLVNGVVTRGLTTTDATSAKVGACGTKLLNGLSMNTIGRPVYGFPSGSPPNPAGRLKRGKRESFSLARVRQQAV